MSAPFTSMGKQVLANGVHYADAADAKAAEHMARVLNAHPSMVHALEWALAELCGKTWYDNAQQALNCFADADAALSLAKGGES